jgi:hypothetical protein
MVQVQGRGDAGAQSYPACRGDVELLDYGVAIRQDTPNQDPPTPVVIPWESISLFYALPNSTADAYGCP